MTADDSKAQDLGGMANSSTEDAFAQFPAIHGTATDAYPDCGWTVVVEA